VTRGITRGITRRTTLTGAAALGAATPLLAACGSDEGGSSDAPIPKAGQALGPAEDVPVGGGKIYPDEQVVVTQPTQGQFKGFSSICTHRQCPVTSVKDGTINCACHGSRFSIDDGSVTAGPAPSPLPGVEVTVEGGEVTTA
jgi:nitrite reductase/ring-hydroxylating ferredoxin subunit